MEKEYSQLTSKRTELSKQLDEVLEKVLMLEEELS
jgi:hypothetical protein